jgi:hypothetical protein
VTGPGESRLPRRQDHVSRIGLALATPQPGQTVCPMCSMPGFAAIDGRGVKIYHSTPMPHRIGGRFADLVSVADPVRQAAWAHAARGEVCPRCSHSRADHVSPETARAIDPTPCINCDCPGPAAVIELETP